MIVSITFPFTPTTLTHRHGGRITRITGIGHTCGKPQCDGRSTDYWFYIGDVEWPEGPVSRNTEIPPWAVCCDSKDMEAECIPLNAAMADYLREHGTFDNGAGWRATVRI